jgi:site-specific recombinase XerD
MADRPAPPTHKGETLPPEVLTPEEAQALIKAASTRAPTGLRNRALMTVLYRAGLRLAEALALKPSDVDTDRGTVRVLRGKGKRARTVGLDAGASAIVARWIDKRKALGLSNGPLFCTLDGRELDQRYVRAMMQRMAKRAGIDKRVHPHGLRHTHAAEMMREGIPANLIQRQLGHSSMQTTSVYLSHLEPAEVIDRIRAREWAL